MAARTSAAAPKKNPATWEAPAAAPKKGGKPSAAEKWALQALEEAAKAAAARKAPSALNTSN